MSSTDRTNLRVTCDASAVSVRAPEVFAHRLRALEPHFAVRVRRPGLADLDVRIDASEWHRNCRDLPSGNSLAYGGSGDQRRPVLSENPPGRWKLVGPDASAFDAMEPTRCVRALMIDRLHLAGWRFLRGAAIVTDGKAVVLAGGRRSGKTSLLLRLLAAGDADLMANDKVAVANASGVAFVRGLPIAAEIRIEALRLLVQEQSAAFSLRSLLGSVEGRPHTLDDAGWHRVRIPLTDLARMFGVAVEPVAPLCAIVFVEPCTRARAFRIVDLCPEEAALATEGQRLRSIREVLPLQDFLAPWPDCTQGPLLATGVPAARVEVGPGIDQADLVAALSEWMRK